MDFITASQAESNVKCYKAEQQLAQDELDSRAQSYVETCLAPEIRRNAHSLISEKSKKGHNQATVFVKSVRRYPRDEYEYQCAIRCKNLLIREFIDLSGYKAESEPTRTKTDDVFNIRVWWGTV